MMTLTFDTREFQRRINGLINTISRAAAQRALTRVGLVLLRDCETIPPTVPIDTGVLRAAATHELGRTGSKISVLAGYDLEYAAFQHELPVTARFGITRARRQWHTYGNKGRFVYTESMNREQAGPKYMEAKLTTQHEKYFALMAAELKRAAGM